MIKIMYLRIDKIHYCMTKMKFLFPHIFGNVHKVLNMTTIKNSNCYLTY